MIVVWMKVYLIYFLIYSFSSVWMKGYLICFLIYSFYSITLFSAQLLATLQIWFCYKITSNQFCLPKSKISFSDAHCDLNFFPDLTVLRSHYKILKKERQAVARRFCKKVFLKVSQNSQEHSCAGVSFLLKLQVWGQQLY